MIRTSENKISISLHQDSQFFPLSYLEEFKEIGNHEEIEFILHNHEDQDKIIDLFSRFGIELEDESELENFGFFFSGDDFIELEIREF